MKQKEKILLWGSNLWMFADAMLGPFFAVFTERIGGDILDISWALAVYYIATGIFVIVVGKFSDGYSKEKLMVFGYGLTAVFTFGYLLVSQPWHLFILQLGLGLALALANPTLYALYDKYSTPHHDGYIWGLADGQSKILMGLAIVFGGFIIGYFSFEILFVIMGFVQIAATL